MRWLQTEYILKGIYLGLLLFVALQQPDWPTMGRVALYTVGGLVLALTVAAVRKLREGHRVGGRWLAFVLFLMLESPILVYAGILLGMTVGVLSMEPHPDRESWLLPLVAGGGALGFVLSLLRGFKQRLARLGLGLVLAAVVVGGVLLFLGLFEIPGIQVPKLDLTGETDEARLARRAIGITLILGIPFFYLLAFAGRAEESEAEIAAMCAVLGIGIALVNLTPQMPGLGFLLPLVLYYWYATRVLPGLRVLKQILRGVGYAQIGRYRQALLAYRDALRLDPNNPRARQEFWNVHKRLDYHQLAADPETIKLVDFDLCLDRTASLLLQSAPSAEQLDEANRLLDLIETNRTPMRPACDYWRALARLRAQQYDEAAALLERVIDPAHYGAGNAQRRGVLLSAWLLALLWHEEMRRRVGLPQLEQPGRRLEAIDAVERFLPEHTDDAQAWNLKRLLYHELTEADYNAAVREGAAAHFDHEYTRQLGLALVEDPVRWQRGCEYLRLAARGLPAQGPSLFTQIAQAHQKAGDIEGVRHYYRLARQAGLAVGHKNLAADERQVFFADVKLLAEDAQGREDLGAAIENYQLYSEYERSGVETLRCLADLYARRGDPLAAARAIDQALVYNAKDPELLARKDSYYYSVMPDDLKARLETYGTGFDVDYCVRKARSVLDGRSTDLDMLDWGQHLAELARVVKPDALIPRVLVARALLRRGEREQAVALLESVQLRKPEKFPSADEEEAWFTSCRLLGDLYLNELGRPDLAATCLQEFRKSTKSGADTIYKLGQAYEQMGDRARAAKFYENVTAYEQHPLAAEARDALYRLQSS